MNSTLTMRVKKGTTDKITRMLKTRIKRNKRRLCSAYSLREMYRIRSPDTRLEKIPVFRKEKEIIPKARNITASFPLGLIICLSFFITVPSLVILEIITSRLFF
jgi:hypothetical protein